MSIPTVRCTRVEAVHRDLLREDLVDVVAHPVVRVEHLGLRRERELRETSDARSDLEDRRVRFAAQLDEGWILWARSDQAHLAFEDIPELRQLIEFRPGEKVAQTGEPHVVRRRERRAGGAVVHLPELEHVQRPPAQAHSPAAVEGRAWAIESDRERQDRDQRAGEHEQNC